MTRNALKQRIAAGDLTIGAWLGVADSVIAEAMAGCGFDWMVADMEHGAIDVADLPAVFAAAERRGVAPLARLPAMDPIAARRALDAGALGLLVPVVEDASRFAEFARHCHYPPQGRRGVGLSRANLWGDDFAGYLADFRPILVPQIETRRGAEAADALAALAETDALFVGPYDLSADLGHPGDFARPAFTQAITAIKAACAEHGKAFGGHQVAPDMAQLRARIAEGYRFLAFGTDVLALRHAFASLKDLARRP